MKSFVDQALFYAAYHQKPITRYTHFIGVPLVILSSLIFLGFIHLMVPGVFDLSFATIATAILLIYYFSLNWRLALVFTPIMIFLLWIASLVSHDGPTSSALWTFLTTFILGWALQLIGHFIEGRRPAFMDNILQALIAPLFLTAELIFMMGKMQDLKEQLDKNADAGEVIVTSVDDEEDQA